MCGEFITDLKNLKLREKKKKRKILDPRYIWNYFFFFWIYLFQTYNLISIVILSRHFKYKTCRCLYDKRNFWDIMIRGSYA